MRVLNSNPFAAPFEPSNAAPARPEAVDLEMGRIPSAAPQPALPQGFQLVAPGAGPMLGAGKVKTTPSVGLAVGLAVAGVLCIATGLAVGLGPDNNSGRWVAGWIAPWCSVGAALLAGSAVACCAANKRATTAC